MRHVARRGDCISSIAFDHGYHPDTLWGHPDNAELRDKRGDPNVLEPGDIVVLPPKEPRSTMCATGKRYTFVRQAVPERLKIKLFHGDEPRAGEAYEIEIDGKTITSGTIGGDGLVHVPIPPNARRGRILLQDGAEEIQLDLGMLPPIDTALGVQARLQNLGYYAGPLNGEEESDDMEEAIVRFQADNEIEPTGYLDEETWEAIRKAHTG